MGVLQPASESTFSMMYSSPNVPGRGAYARSMSTGDNEHSRQWLVDSTVRWLCIPPSM